MVHNVRMNSINLADLFDRIGDYWNPRTVGEVNDSYVKAVKFQGPFVMHTHEVEDEMFLVVDGSMVMRFIDREVPVKTGEFIIVPHGVEHCPVADGECSVLLFEPRSTLNTGDVRNERTREVLERM